MPIFKHHHRVPLNAGFTLIEVMVALLILSVVVGALSVAVSQSTANISHLKQRQFALWVAQNNLNLYLLNAQSNSSGSSDFAGNQYLWNITKSGTDTKQFSKITIDVTSKKQPKYRLAQLITFKDES